MDLLSSSDLGSATMSVCNHPDYPTGTLLLELLYLSECLAPAALEAQRYLPPTCHRLLLDIQGRNHADQITSEALRGTCLTGNKKLIAAVMKSQGTRIKPLLAQGESLAKAASTAVVATAIQTMQHELNAELKRLQALAEVNPTVRAEEIEQWAARCELLEVYLQQTRVRLDAIHVIVMR